MEASNISTDHRLESQIFFLTLIGKTLNGLVELGLGILLLLTSSIAIQNFASLVTAHELQEDPVDIVANLVLATGETIGATQQFIALYLLIHGVIKILLAYFLLRKEIKVYPWAITILSIFMLYQGYITWQKFSIAILALTVFDAIIVWLAIREYRYLSNDKSLL